VRFGVTAEAAPGRRDIPVREPVATGDERTLQS